MIDPDTLERTLGEALRNGGDFAEVFAEQEVGGSRTNSALIGLIWKRRENLSFDLGMRSARTNGLHVNEVRAGLTWATSFGK